MPDDDVLPAVVCTSNSDNCSKEQKNGQVNSATKDSVALTPLTVEDCDESFRLLPGSANKELLELEKELSKPVPSDRLSLVYLIFLVHGIGTLMPWNVFITADKYFVDLKLKSKPELRDNFLSYLGIAAQLPNLFMNLLNIFCHCGGSLSKRIMFSILVIMACVVFTIILALLDTSTSWWTITFFWLTMGTVVVINSATGVYQNSVYGLAADLPMKYSGAIVLGNNISGTLTAVISIVSLAVSPNLQMATVYYFIIALSIVFICFCSYFVLPRCRYFKYYDKVCRLRVEKEKGEQRKVESKNRSPEKSQRLRQTLAPFIAVFKQAWIQLWNVFLVFFVTLAIFPAIQANVEAVDKEFFISEVYFTPITCFLLFNFFAMVGNIVPHWIRWPGPRYLWVPIMARVLMIPYLMFCNYRPHDRALPVLINSDWAYIFMAILMAFTSGYFSSLCMMYAPKCVEPSRAGIAGMMAAFFLMLGIVAGINFQLVISTIVGRQLNETVPAIGTLN